jgi:hypothetical protein
MELHHLLDHSSFSNYICTLGVILVHSTYLMLRDSCIFCYPSAFNLSYVVHSTYIEEVFMLIELFLVTPNLFSCGHMCFCYCGLSSYASGSCLFALDLG